MKRLTPGNFPTESVHLAFEYAREGFCLRKEGLPYSHWFLVECFCFQHVILASEISRMTATQDSGNKYFELHIERVQIVKKTNHCIPTFANSTAAMKPSDSECLGITVRMGIFWKLCAILEDQIVCFTIWDAKFSRGSQKRDVACPTGYHLSEKYVYSLGPALASLFAIYVRRGVCPQNYL